MLTKWIFPGVASAAAEILVKTPNSKENIHYSQTGPDLSFSLKVSGRQRAAEKQVRTDTAGHGTTLVRPQRQHGVSASPLRSAAPRRGAPARGWLQVCPAPHARELWAARGCWPRSKVAANKDVASAGGWALAITLQPRASALLSSRCHCTALGNNCWSLCTLERCLLASFCTLALLAPFARGSGQCPCCRDTGDVLHPPTRSGSPQATPSRDLAIVCFGCHC